VLLVEEGEMGKEDEVHGDGTGWRASCEEAGSVGGVVNALDCKLGCTIHVCCNCSKKSWPSQKPDISCSSSALYSKCS